MSKYLRVSIHIGKYKIILICLTKDPLNQTTIIVEKTTRESLKHIARKDQTYDSLLQELILLKERIK